LELNVGSRHQSKDTHIPNKKDLQSQFKLCIILNTSWGTECFEKVIQALRKAPLSAKEMIDIDGKNANLCWISHA